MNLFGMLELSGSALGAERQRAIVAAGGSALDVQTAAVGVLPSRRMYLWCINFGMFGSPPVMRFEPGHPDANPQGYVAYPQVDPIEEMTDLLGAVRAYELNASAVQATKNMIQQSLDLLR